MQLIADLVEQLNGSVQVNQDAGTTVRIVFLTAKQALLNGRIAHQR
jgi:two-component sensor histidine kinase